MKITAAYNYPAQHIAPSTGARDILWDNGNDDGTGAGLSSQLANDYPFNSQIADDFILADGGFIESVHWWGAWWNGAYPYPNPVEFNVIFYADDGTGTMPTGAGSSDPTSTALAVYNFPSVTGTEIGYARYEYDATLSSVFSCEAGVKYWIAIQCVSYFSGVGQWGFVMNGMNPEQLSSAMQGFPLLGTPYWTNPGYGDAAFSLSGYTQQYNHDVTVKSIDSPVSGPANTFTPTVTVKNAGLNEETFPVQFAITSFSNPVTLVGQNAEGWVPDVPAIPPTFPPTNWQVYNIDGGDAWVYSSTGGHNAPGCAKITYDTANNDWLVTAPVVIPAASSFSFWLQGYTYNSDPYEIYMSTTGNTPDDFLNGTLLASGIAASTYTEMIFDTSAYEGQTAWFAIRYTGVNEWYLWVDDVVLPDGTTVTFEGTPAVPGYFPDWTIEQVVGTTPKWAGQTATQHPSGYAPVQGSYLAQFNSYSCSNGYEARLKCNTPVDLGSAGPTVMMNIYVFHDSGYSSSLGEGIDIQLSTDGISWTNYTFIQRYNATTGWQLHQFDISSMFGQVIYVAILGHSMYGNDCYFDDFSIVASGISTEYDETQTVTLAPGEEIQLVYSTWAPAAWQQVENIDMQYTCTATATLESDEMPGNNVKVKTVYLHYPYFHDVAMNQIISPVSGLGGIMNVQTIISNNGQFTETFNANAQIGTKVYNDAIFTDFEADNGGFTTTSTIWGYGTPSGSAPAAYSGVNVWGAALAGGTYPVYANEHLYTPEITGVPANAKLEFYLWYDLEYGCDGLNVQISTDDGATWNLLGAYMNPYTYSYVSGLGGQPGFCGYGAYWAPYVFDLSAYAGMDIMLDFHFGSDVSIAYTGAYIDNVRVYTVSVNPEYDATIPVTLAPGAVQTVDFPQWTPSVFESGDNLNMDYIMSASTALAGDENVNNDAVYQEFSLFFPYRYDVGVSQIVQPWSDGDGQTLPVIIDISNFGSHDATNFGVSVTIATENGVQYTAGTTIDFLGAYQTQALQFDDWTPEELANGAQGWIPYTITVTTTLANDGNTANDIMVHNFQLFYTYLYDVGIVSINSPVNDGVGQPYPVSVTVGAYGTVNPPAFDTHVQIGQQYVINDCLDEDFSNGCPPAGWGTNYPANWILSQSNYAGGEAPEAEFSWTPSATDNFRLYTGPIDTAGITNIDLSFKMYVNDYNGDYNLAVETSTDGVTWNTVWTVPGGAYPAQTVTIPLSSADGLGSSTFQVAWTFIGYSFNINYWYIDDVLMQNLGLIPEFDQTIAGTVLEIGQTADLDFGTWTPQAYSQGQNGDITYICSATTILADDFHWENDAQGASFTLHYANDVQVTEISSPGALNAGKAGTYYMQPGTISISGQIKNVGTYPEYGLTATTEITSGYSESIPGINMNIGELIGLEFPNAVLDTEGTYTLTMSLPLGNDANPGDNSKSMTIGVDATAPVVSYTLNPTAPNDNNGWYISDVSVKLTATDAMSGVKTIKYKLDDGPWVTYSSEITVSANGEHTVYYYAIDKVNNTGAEQQVTVKLDKELPQIALSKQILVNKIKFTAQCSDAYSNVSRVEFYLLDELQFNDTDGSNGWAWTLHPIPQGTNYTVTAIVFDNAGNSASVISEPLIQLQQQPYTNPQVGSSQPTPEQS